MKDEDFSRLALISCYIASLMLKCLMSRQDGPLAQLAEQLTLNQQVTGSIPVRLTIQVLQIQKNPLFSQL